MGCEDPVSETQKEGLADSFQAGVYVSVNNPNERYVFQDNGNWTVFYAYEDENGVLQPGTDGGTWKAAGDYIVITVTGESESHSLQLLTPTSFTSGDTLFELQ